MGEDLKVKDKTVRTLTGKDGKAKPGLWTPVGPARPQLKRREGKGRRKSSGYGSRGGWPLGYVVGRLEVAFILYPMFNLHVTAICLQAFLATALDFVFSPSQSHLVFRFSQRCPLSYNFKSYSACLTVYKLLLGFSQSISAHLHRQKELITPCRHAINEQLTGEIRTRDCRNEHQGIPL